MNRLEGLTSFFFDLLTERKSWLGAEFYGFFRFLDVKDAVSYSVSVQLMRVSKRLSWQLRVPRFKAEYCDNNDVCCQNSLIVIFADNVYRRLVRKRWAFIWPKSWFGMNISWGLFSAEHIITHCSLTTFRRTLEDRIFGRPLVDLKKPHNHLWMLHFTAEERILYRAVEQRFREMINEWFADGDKKKNLTYFVVQVTRLRQ